MHVMKPDAVDGVRTKADLVAHLQALRRDLETNPERWENTTLDRYLGALASWLEDADGYYLNRGETPPTSPSWKTIAEMLNAAGVYE
jgi:hypothetical protein